MSDKKYLDDNGLLYFWQKIKNLFALKTELPGVVSKTAAGLAPQLPNESTTTKYLRQDGSWSVPPGNQVSPATDTPSDLGTAAVGSSAKYAREDHVHKMPSASDVGALPDNTQIPEVSYGNDTPVAGTAGSGEIHIDPGEIYLKFGSIPVATSSADGLMSSADKTKLDGFQAASNYALKSEISGAYRYKGSVATASLLPSSGNEAGDVWNIEAASTYGEAGTNVAWTGSAWDSLGTVWKIVDITNSDIDTIVAS